jgi:hypothetical protein
VVLSQIQLLPPVAPLKKKNININRSMVHKICPFVLPLIACNKTTLENEVIYSLGILLLLLLSVALVNRNRHFLVRFRFQIPPPKAKDARGFTA